MAIDTVEKLTETEHVEVPTEPILYSQDRELERATLLLLDLVLLPVVAMIYLLSMLDRSNVGNARVAGMQKDLKLTDWEYQVAITVTYVPYICAELPSNLVLAKIGPRILLPGLTVSWGLVTLLQSQIQGFSGLVACRFFLGLSESGIVPGIVVYLAGFYQRAELQLRICIFFCAAAVAGAFSGLLAAGIVNMDGLANMEGWRWIFLIEGLFTVVFGLVSFFLMPNKPSQVLTFQAKHVKCCEERLLNDTVTKSRESTEITWGAFVSTYKSFHMWGFFVLQLAMGLCFYGLAYFLPSIVATLTSTFDPKPSKVQVQLLTVPPYAAAFAVALITSLLSNRYNVRGIAAAVPLSVAVVGFSMFLGIPVKSAGARYGALHLVVIGIFGASPALLVWIPNNMAAYTRRTAAVASAFIGTNIGGIASTWIYPSSSAPSYTMGARINLAMSIVTLACVLGLMWWFHYQNKKKVARRDQILKEVEHLSPKEQYELLGDHHPNFRYTV